MTFTDLNAEQLRGYFIEEKCPRCGCTLLGNSRGHKWCSFVGGREEKACSYGIDRSSAASVTLIALYPNVVVCK